MFNKWKTVYKQENENWRDLKSPRCFLWKELGSLMKIIISFRIIFGLEIKKTDGKKNIK